MITYTLLGSCEVNCCVRVVPQSTRYQPLYQLLWCLTTSSRCWLHVMNDAYVSRCFGVSSWPNKLNLTLMRSFRRVNLYSFGWWSKWNCIQHTLKPKTTESIRTTIHSQHPLHWWSVVLHVEPRFCGPNFGAPPGQPNRTQVWPRYRFRCSGEVGLHQGGIKRIRLICLKKLFSFYLYKKW